MKKFKLLAVVLVLVVALGIASTAFAAASATVTGGTTLTEGYITGPTLNCSPQGFAATNTPNYNYAWYLCTNAPTNVAEAEGGTNLSTTVNQYTVPLNLAAAASPYYYACVITDTANGSEKGFGYTTVTVSAPVLTYTLGVTAGSNFPNAIEGYTSLPPVKTFTITNTGTGTVSNIAAALTGDTTHFTITSTSPAVSLAPGATTTFNVQPAANLTAATYTCGVRVTGDAGASATTGDISFTVESKTYTLGVTPATQDFGSLAAGYTQPAAKSFTVNNTGNTQETGVTATLGGTDASSFTITTAPATSIAAGGSTTFSVRPVAGLTTAKTYNATVTVTGANNPTGVTCNVSFTVAAADYTFTLHKSGETAEITNIDFGAAGSGYTQPAAVTVVVKNTGNSPITFAAPTSSAGAATKYTISGLNRATVPVGGTAQFTVRPKANLATGPYSENIIVAQSTDPANFKYFTVTFTVNTAYTYTIKANPATVTFPALSKNYSSVGLPSAITVTNTGNTACNVTSVTSSAGTSSAFTMNVPALPCALAASGTTGNTMAITAQPKTGLAAGTYTETITVTTDMNTRTTFTLSVTVGSGSTTGTTNTVYNSGKYIWASGAFKAGSTLTTTRLYSGSDRYDGLYKLRDGNTVLCCYDLSASPSQTVSGRVDVSFSLGTEYAGKKMTVLHTISGGRVEYLYGTVASNGVLTVTTSYGLSPFMVVNGTLTAVTVTSPDTGDAATFAFIGIVLMLGGCALLVIRRRKA